MLSFLLRNTSFIFCRRNLPMINRIKSVNFNNIRQRYLNLKQHNTIVRNFHLSSSLERIVSFNLSDIGEGIREVTIKEWFVKEGDVVEQFDNLCEVQSDKASVTITSRYDGKILKIYHNVDEIALVGKPLVDFEIEDEEQQPAKKSESKENDTEKIDSSDSDESDTDEKIQKNRIKVLATPAVRRIAMEKNVDLSKVPATGKLGRILKGDVLEYLGEIPIGTNKLHPTLLQTHQNKTDSLPPSSSSIVNLMDRKVEVLKGIRKAMFKSMTESLKIPHFAYSDEVDMTNLIEVRKNLLNEASKNGIQKLTFMPFCIKAASLSLNQFPILNSSIDLENESIIYKSNHNISVAIDTPNGLVVPNIKNCQNKSVLSIARNLQELLERARNGNLKPEDFAEGTFSLSNIGMLGGTYTHPCILPPQVAIGAMGKTKLTPRFDEIGNLVKANIMCISWSADHRVIDGVTMAKFSNLWKNYLENPTLFLLH